VGKTKVKMGETGVNRGSIEVKQGWRSVKKRISPKWAYF
jgi:hypothetical protein